ncbi:hypothetical protein MPTK1_3g13660 [Marchantia polymorpha subsp. ruderalis]|uniref:Uncharacterized protein n=2 Tax=Marchantia polymorpha TaxID=3197 RepID=A0AAF6B0G9_MARPO|nr:hypothetical protein MARPO_0004s0305 [Marchantia polymorpha]BBN05503.1 hypothetical protein Mp_3g13660 [Marchantia polymorpha subsp. ruderalis]|eukprot:PTQ49082.1 hypothetical protein MARPO_0004s0305 [Marchantia polymorpha]
MRNLVEQRPRVFQPIVDITNSYHLFSRVLIKAETSPRFDELKYIFVLKITSRLYFSNLFGYNQVTASFLRCMFIHV